jgi:hypothetical protein
MAFNPYSKGVRSLCPAQVLRPDGRGGGVGAAGAKEGALI